jgi:hypothetical protein
LNWVLIIFVLLQSTSDDLSVYIATLIEKTDKPKLRASITMFMIDVGAKWCSMPYSTIAMVVKPKSYVKESKQAIEMYLRMLSPICINNY